jgi:hypothetical protein
MASFLAPTTYLVTSIHGGAEGRCEWASSKAREGGAEDDGVGRVEGGDEAAAVGADLF